MKSIYTWKDLAPKEQAKHPDTPPDVLFSELLQDYTEEVLSNPALPLIAVENPEMWEKIQWGARLVTTERNLIKNLQPLSLKIRSFFAVECAQKVLPYFERQFPNDLRIRHALEVSKHPKCSNKYLEELEKIQESLLETLQNTEEKKEHASRFFLRHVKIRYKDGFASKEEIALAKKLGIKESDIAFGYAAHYAAESSYQAILATSLFVTSQLFQNTKPHSNFEESLQAAFRAAMAVKQFTKATFPKEIRRSEVEFVEREFYIARLQELLGFE